MYITIDGASGAGKTTQAFLLHQRLALEYTCFLPVVYTIEAVPHIVNCQSAYTNVIAALLASHTIPVNADCVVEDFWKPFQSLQHLGATELNNIIQFFQTGVTLGGRQPALSIYLSIPYDVHVKRVYNRNTGGTIEPTFDKANMNSFEELNRFWGTISAQVSYFHVVDGTMPKEDVYDSIRCLMT